MEKEHQLNKHLTYEEREYIEIGLNKGRNFTKISKEFPQYCVQKLDIDPEFKKDDSCTIQKSSYSINFNKLCTLFLNVLDIGYNLI